jgi:hypothetical protein
MGTAFGVVAFLVALAGLLVAGGNAGYLAMLGSAAKSRGISGESTAGYVRERRTTAAILLGITVLGLVFTLGGTVPDLIGLVLGAGGGLAAFRALDGTRRRFRS